MEKPEEEEDIEGVVAPAVGVVNLILIFEPTDGEVHHAVGDEEDGEAACRASVSGSERDNDWGHVRGSVPRVFSVAVGGWGGTYVRVDVLRQPP